MSVKIDNMSQSIDMLEQKNTVDKEKLKEKRRESWVNATEGIH